jgi:hypothetical protein
MAWSIIRLCACFLGFGALATLAPCNRTRKPFVMRELVDNLLYRLFGAPSVRDRNFAPTFPFLDPMFGAFHMPRGQSPEGFGAEGAPRRIPGQRVYPVRLMLERLPGLRLPRPDTPSASS